MTPEERKKFEALKQRVNAEVVDDTEELLEEIPWLVELLDREAPGLVCTHKNAHILTGVTFVPDGVDGECYWCLDCGAVGVSWGADKFDFSAILPNRILGKDAKWLTREGAGGSS